MIEAIQDQAMAAVWQVLREERVAIYDHMDQSYTFKECKLDAISLDVKIKKILGRTR